MKTPKGTELPMLKLKGKDYLEVKYRIVWFREEHPDWGIATECVEHGPGHAIFKASILDRDGYAVATAHKMETKQGFPDFLEKAETGAVGRALAYCGYGTQFAPELEEGERIVDAPTAKPTRAHPPAGDAPPQGGEQGKGHPQFGPPWPKPEDADPTELEAFRNAKGIPWNCEKCERPVKYYLTSKGKPLFQCEFARTSIVDAYKGKKKGEEFPDATKMLLKHIAEEHTQRYV